MKHPTLSRAALALSVLLLALTVTAASGCGTKLQETPEGVKINGEEEKVFLHASVVYEPVELGQKYGSLQVSESMKLKVWSIEGLSPAEWLATEDGDVLYAEDVHLPTLTEMSPASVQVCAYQASVHVLRRVGDPDVLSSLVTAWETAENAPYLNRTPLRSFKLRFESEAYPSLYYSVLYLEYAEDLVSDGVNYGRYFLYSAFESRFVPVDGALHALFDFGDGTSTAG